MIRQTLNCLRHTRAINSIGAHSARHLSQGDIAAQEDLDEIYDCIRMQRFVDIVVIQTKFNANPRYFILANCFNARHLMSGTEKVNKHFKTTVRKKGQEFARLSLSSGWNVLDFDSVVVHLFSKESRDHFDIEQLWAVGEKYDDLLNNTPPPPPPSEDPQLNVVYPIQETENDPIVNEGHLDDKTSSLSSVNNRLAGLRIPDAGGG